MSPDFHSIQNNIYINPSITSAVITALADIVIFLCNYLLFVHNTELMYTVNTMRSSLGAWVTYFIKSQTHEPET